MAESSAGWTLDEMFEALEEMHVPEGIKTEIVGGVIVMTPQRDNHWDIIAAIYEQLRTKFPRQRVKSDVRIDYPGYLNGFATDVTLIAEDAEKNEKGQWLCEDVVFVAEVISKGTALNDYGPKKEAYAAAEVPVYLIVDPYTGKWVAHMEPKDGDFTKEVRSTFGDPVDLTDTPVGIVLTTDDFATE